MTSSSCVSTSSISLQTNEHTDGAAPVRDVARLRVARAATSRFSVVCAVRFTLHPVPRPVRAATERTGGRSRGRSAHRPQKVSRAPGKFFESARIGARCNTGTDDRNTEVAAPEFFELIAPGSSQEARVAEAHEKAQNAATARDDAAASSAEEGRRDRRITSRSWLMCRSSITEFCSAGSVRRTAKSRHWNSDQPPLSATATSCRS